MALAVTLALATTPLATSLALAIATALATTASGVSKTPHERSAQRNSAAKIAGRSRHAAPESVGLEVGLFTKLRTQLCEPNKCLEVLRGLHH
jgi:hypothetical protein